MKERKHFNVGDAVVLKTGGPDMVIESFDTDHTGHWAWCVWFNGSKVERDRFSSAALIAREEPAKR